jgi:hypothetical protein
MIAQCKLPRYDVIPHRTGPVGDDLFISVARLEGLGAEQYIVKRALAYDDRVFYKECGRRGKEKRYV